MKIKLLSCIVLNTLLIGLAFPSVSLAESDEGYHITFEDGPEGFGPRGENETVEQTNEDAYEGKHALKVTGRTEAWNGPSLQISELVEESMEYHFSVRVKLVDEGSAELQLSTQIGEGNNASYQTIDNQRVNSHTWKLLEGTYRYDSIVDDFISVYVESSGNDSVSYMIDDFTLTPTGNKIETPTQSDVQSIKEVYEEYFLIGNAVSMSDLGGQRLELLKEHHNLVTAENAMKPDSSYNANQEFDVTDQIRLVDRVKEEGLLLHGHVLVWHQQSPEWLH
uniref:carbohydrate binding domain-containing protein n=1 Tax=Jeotgalibaca porci TaxID=1868793 RepID=UPI0035A09EBF